MLLQGPVVSSMIKASLKMIGISIILLITFLCLALPGLIFDHHMESDFPKYIFIWKVKSIQSVYDLQIFVFSVDHVGVPDQQDLAAHPHPPQ